MELLERATLAPPDGAAWERVTVQVVLEDAVRLVLGHCNELSVACELTLRVTAWLVPLRVAVMVAL